MYNKPTFRISAEDSFLIVQLCQEHELLPDENELFDKIGYLLDYFGNRFTIIGDFTKGGSSSDLVTSDVFDFLELCPVRTILFDQNHPEHLDLLKYRLRKETVEEIEFVPVRNVKFNYSKIDISLFETSGAHLPYETILENKEKLNNIIRDEPKTRDETAYIEISHGNTELANFEFLDYERSMFFDTLDLFPLVRYFRKTFREIGRNSLMMEYCITNKGDMLGLQPFRTNALYQTADQAEDQIIVARPSVLAKRTRSLFSSEIDILNHLINDPKVTEHEIHKFLSENPSIFDALGYYRVHSKVVLHRDDDTKLIPDFIVEPYGEKWANIIDIKKPDVNLAVGRKDRKGLSAAVHDLANQLREYGAYFENDKYAKAIEDSYGIKCYRPKLIGVIGRDVDLQNEKQQRRMMTGYRDVEFMTFDQLLEFAKSRLLI